MIRHFRHQRNVQKDSLENRMNQLRWREQTNSRANHYSFFSASRPAVDVREIQPKLGKDCQREYKPCRDRFGIIVGLFAKSIMLILTRSACLIPVSVTLKSCQTLNTFAKIESRKEAHCSQRFHRTHIIVRGFALSCERSFNCISIKESREISVVGRNTA